MTWSDIQIGDEFDKFGIKGVVIKKIKSIHGDYTKTIEIEKDDKETVFVSIGGKQ